MSEASRPISRGLASDEARCHPPHLVREQSRSALLLVDVINDFTFPNAERLLPAANAMALRLARLRTRARKAGVPCIYANDNFGRWRSDLRALVRHSSRADAPGRELVATLMPKRHDYFVLKPLNSAFFSTVLETLLRHLGVDTLILGGLATDNCVLFTAHDAYLRGMRLLVPRDCSAAETELRHRRALRFMRETMKADTRPSRALRLAELQEAP